MIVWLASYPRSGNTFFRVVLHHAYNLKTSSVYDEAVLDRVGVADVVGHEQLPAPVGELRASPEVFFVKTHDLPTDDSPAVYLIRDGRDALVSHAKYVLSFGKKKGIPFLHNEEKEFERALEKLISEKPQFGGWSNHVRSWTARPNAKTVVVRFDELIASPQAQVEQALAMLDLNLKTLSGGAVPDFAALQKQSPEFFRKGKSGTWREEMSPRLQEIFMQHHREVMEQFGYLPAKAH
jgi:hypothetical protein